MSIGPFSVLIALPASARQSGHLALLRDKADTMVVLVSYNDVILSVHCDSKGPVELSNGSFSVSMAPDASARQSGHLAMRGDLMDTTVQTVSHEDVAVSVYCDSTGILELSNGPFSVSMALFASARQSGHMALWFD
jgi:hypothetical protein